MAKAESLAEKPSEAGYKVLLLQGLLLFVFYFVGAKISLRIPSGSGLSPLLWIPSGIGLAGLTLWSLALWPAVFLASFLLGILGHFHLIGATSLATGSAVGAFFGAYFLRKSSSGFPTLARVNQVVVLSVLAVGVGSCIGSFLQVTGLRLVAVIPAEQFYVTWRSWWLSEAMSDLIVGGILISWCNDIRFRIGRHFKRPWEFSALGLLVCLIVVINYTGLIPYNPSVLLRPYLLFAMIIWGALRFDLTGVMLVNFLVATGVMYGRYHGFSPASPISSEADRAAIQQLLVLTLGIVGVMLAATTREKQEAIDARSEFLVLASHELKTPITAIKLQIELFLKKIRLNSATYSTLEEQIKFANRTGLQVDRMVRVVEQLFEVSRIERRDLVLNFETVDLTRLVRSILQRLSDSLTSAGCQVKTEMPEELVGHWDYFRIEQVFENILSNAMKYAARSEIFISALQKDGWVDITIRDKGPGINEEKKTVIFDRFVRAYAKSVNAHDGLGLGLFISKQIISAHRGTIKVQSKEGEGTSFHIHIPVEASDASRSVQVR
jgi:signal transduction histidine kinase